VGDNFHPEHSHVVAGMMRRFHEAKLSGADKVVVWGTGSPLRELIDADDLADACVFLLNHYDGGDMINTGSGQEISIRELALLMKTVVGFDGEVQFDTSRPDGTPRKLMDNSKISALGWRPSLTVETGIAKMYRWFVESGAASVVH
jgi:GDP-L-fucose synthase